MGNLMQFVNNTRNCGTMVWIGFSAGDNEVMEGDRLTSDLLQPLQVVLRIRELSSDDLTQENAIAEDINFGGVRDAGGTGVCLGKCFRGCVYDGPLSSCLRQTG